MSTTVPDDMTRCGFVAVLGAPNAGKSTLVNMLVGTKVSIVSPKVQTTRIIVRGIAMHDQSQIVFVDTPGIFDGGKRRLERAMVSAAWSGADDADAILFVIDGSKTLGRDASEIVSGLARRKSHKKCPVILVINKVDVAEKELLLVLADHLNKAISFHETFMISALTGEGSEFMLDVIAQEIPLGPWLYPEDDVSDLPQRMLASEITREKLFLTLHQELPYDCAVETINWEVRNDGSVRIDQTIYVSRNSQKPIVLGKAGRTIKTVGEQARLEIGELLDIRVHLFLHVKVQPEWREQRARYRSWNLNFDA
ncbi:MAG: GTPase Era [Rhodospirillaceae bacterium]